MGGWLDFLMREGPGVCVCGLGGCRIESKYDEPEIPRSLVSAFFRPFWCERKDLTREWGNLECYDGVTWLDM